jgi:putative spermidine/putrescine transport system ATP-binding protein
MRIAMTVVAAVTLFFIVLPIVALIPMSFSSASFLSFPPRGFSLRWYDAFFSSRDWMEALANSVKVAVAVTVLACVLGTPAGMALARASFRGKEAVRALILAPIIVPIMVLAIGFYYVYAQFHLVGTILALVLGHLVIATPYVVLNVEAVMRTFDTRLERAARMLGATSWQAFTRVVLPLIRTGVLAGALFALITSFDELVIAIFLSGTRTITLPKRMFASISQDELNPMVGAIATLQIGMAFLVLAVTEVLRGRNLGLFAHRKDTAEDDAGDARGLQSRNGPSKISTGAAPELDLRGERLRLVNLTKRFGVVVAAEGVSLEVQAGEFLTLLGPSGSGKTTILNLVAGFEQPSTGEILIGDVPITHIAPNHRNIGMVFQDYALFPHMTVFENIAFPLRLRKMPERDIRRRVEEILDVVRLIGYRNRTPRQLSGGEQQRVALARSLVFHPPLLLMDEPLGALDKNLRESMQIELRHLHHRFGITVLFVTHDQEEAMTMSDRIAVINRGRLQQVGRPEELYESPANEFVANFIGESNLLPAEVTAVAGGRLRVRTAGGSELVVTGDGRRVGERLLVLMRPESLRLSLDEGAAESSLLGVIEEVIYLGGFRRYTIRINPQEVVTVKLPPQVGTGQLASGTRVHVILEPEAARVL